MVLGWGAERGEEAGEPWLFGDQVPLPLPLRGLGEGEWVADIRAGY